MVFNVAATTGLLLLLPLETGASSDHPTEGDRLFALKVGPILSQKCDACHGGDPDKIKGGFKTLTRDDLLAGGESIPDVLVPGIPEESFLLTAVRWDDPDYEMPPKEDDRLTEEQTNDLERWIRLGAPWPDEEMQAAIRLGEREKEITADGVLVATSGGLDEDWTHRRYRPEDVWAFQPLQMQTAPPAAAAEPESPPANPIDEFIARRLAGAGVEPAPPADPRTLVRRATFDLTGLPPTPDEVNVFVSAWDADPDHAWETLIDRLLASPRYGERWAQHWLDVARYADTGGMANDFERSNMWRYRDYVIRAFNDDMPYDRFVVEQLAGDELADESALRRLGDRQKLEETRRSGDYTDEEARMIVATGFLRLGPWDNAMITSEEARQIYLDDVVNAVGQTFLATTMRCVKCHDHKFDPIPTRDYYRMYAAFAGTQMAERPLRFAREENLDRFEGGRTFVQRMLDFASAEKRKLEDRREDAARAWYAEHDLPYKDADARKDDPDETKPPRNIGMDHVAEGRLKVREQDEWIWQRALERYQPMVQGVYNGPDVALAWNGARKLRLPGKIDSDWTPTSHVYLGGSLTAPGDVVTPGVLSAVGLPVPGTRGGDPYRLPDPVTGRRLALAHWIAHPENPLTTRAIVNRIWLHHFGKAIAGNPNNFGAKGAKPTHPELLDFLASDFVGNGWKLKRLHKLIMTSETYRMSTRHPQAAKLRDADPDNALLASFPVRRLSAEELRDAMLVVTGELNPMLGGLPVMPEINMEVALQPRMIQFSLAPAYQPSRTPAERNRRSIYACRIRGQADPFLEVFNQPNPNDSCEARGSASVSPQAFTLFNSDWMSDRSIALAARIGKSAHSPEDQVREAFTLALGREPTADEQVRLSAYLLDMRRYHDGTPPEPVVYPTSITQSLVEEFSGLTFEYEEILPVFEGYAADLKPADVDPATRALADVCLLLFNTHEFIHVY